MNNDALFGASGSRLTLFGRHADQVQTNDKPVLASLIEWLKGKDTRFVMYILIDAETCLGLWREGSLGPEDFATQAGSMFPLQQDVPSIGLSAEKICPRASELTVVGLLNGGVHMRALDYDLQPV